MLKLVLFVLLIVPLFIFAADSASLKTKPPHTNIEFEDMDGVNYKARIKYIDSTWLVFQMLPEDEKTWLDSPRYVELTQSGYRIHYSNLKKAKIKKARAVATNTFAGLFGGTILMLPVSNALMKEEDTEDLGGYILLGGMALGTTIGFITGLYQKKTFKIDGRQEAMEDLAFYYLFKHEKKPKKEKSKK